MPGNLLESPLCPLILSVPDHLLPPTVIAIDHHGRLALSLSQTAHAFILDQSSIHHGSGSAQAAGQLPCLRIFQVEVL